MNGQYETIYDFCKANRVEISAWPDGIHRCYINEMDFENPKPWAVANNILDAIDQGVINYLSYHSQNSFLAKNNVGQVNTPIIASDFKDFLNKEGRLFWYYFAVKYNKKRLIEYYESHADKTHPNYKMLMKAIVDAVSKSLIDIHHPMVEGEQTPAIYNIWVQSLVYYESLVQEKYQNNKVIVDLLTKLSEDEKSSFQKIQELIGKINEEIQTINE